MSYRTLTLIRDTDRADGGVFGFCIYATLFTRNIYTMRKKNLHMNLIISRSIIVKIHTNITSYNMHSIIILKQ